MTSPYGQAVDLTGLHPRLRDYFGPIPAGSVGRGSGVFSTAGTPRRWLWPVLALLGRQGVVFAAWQHDVPFSVLNREVDGARTARRVFALTGGDRTMVDSMRVVDGALVDTLGPARRYEATFAAVIEEGALRLRSTALRLRVGGLRVQIPGRVDLTERWDEPRQQQHVSVVISVPLVGRVYEYAGYFDYEVGPTTGGPA